MDEPLFLATRTIDYWSSDEEKRILISIADFENWRLGSRQKRTLLLTCAGAGAYDAVIIRS